RFRTKIELRQNLGCGGGRESSQKYQSLADSSNVAPGSAGGLDAASMHGLRFPLNPHSPGKAGGYRSTWLARRRRSAMAVHKPKSGGVSATMHAARGSASSRRRQSNKARAASPSSPPRLRYTGGSGWRANVSGN